MNDKDMARGEFEIVNARGLHARAASKLVQLLASYSCEVQARGEAQSANAKSVMGMLLLCGAKGTRLSFVAKGADAEAAIGAIGALIADKFGEEE